MFRIISLSVIISVLMVLALPAMAMDVTYSVLEGNCQLQAVSFSTSEPDSNLLLAPPAPKVECFIVYDRWSEDKKTRNMSQACRLSSSTGRVIAEVAHSEGYYSKADDGTIEGYFLLQIPSQGCTATVNVAAVE